LADHAVLPTTMLPVMPATTNDATPTLHGEPDRAAGALRSREEAGWRRHHVVVLVLVLT
jgi:hypothetical protein